MFLCSTPICLYGLMFLCSWPFGHTCCGIRMCGSMVVCWGGFCIAASSCVGPHMELRATTRSRPDPLVGVSGLTRATLEAMCDLTSSYVLMFVYVFLCLFLMCDRSKCGLSFLWFCSNVLYEECFSFSHAGFWTLWKHARRCCSDAAIGERAWASLEVWDQGIAYMYVYDFCVLLSSHAVFSEYCVRLMLVF